MADADPRGGKGRRQRPDLTQGSIRRTLLTFALPTLGSNVLQSLSGSINSIWVGRFLGESALAATANANIIMFLLFSTFFGFGMAATVIVGQAMGARDIPAARHAFAGAFGFSVLIACLAALAGFAFTPGILRALSTPGDAYQMALTYMQVLFVSMPASLMTVMITMGMRGTGDSTTPFYFMVLQVVLGTGLNPPLILGFGPIPAMGIAGSAWATVIANFVTLVAILAYVYRTDMVLRLRGSEFRWLVASWAELRLIITKGLPMGLQMIVSAGAGLIVVGLVNHEGLMVTAAYAATQQLWTYLQMPAMAVGSAASAMAAQNIGAGLWDRVNSITRNGLLFNLVMSSLILVPMIVFDQSLLGLFLGAGSEAIEVGRHIQLLGGWGFVLMGMTLVLFGTMRANGVVIAPLIVMIISFYPVRLGFYWLFHNQLGADAIWLCFPAGSATSLILAAALYMHGGWRKATLMVPPDEEECVEYVQSEGESAGRMTPNG